MLQVFRYEHNDECVITCVNPFTEVSYDWYSKYPHGDEDPIFRSYTIKLKIRYDDTFLTTIPERFI